MSDSMHPIPHDPKDVEPGGLVLTELVDKVPTAYLPEGGGFLDWSVTPMPAADRVERFLDELSDGTKFDIFIGRASEQVRRVARADCSNDLAHFSSSSWL